MTKYLFFDDRDLFRRENLTRVCGKPEWLCAFRDGHSDMSWSTGYVFRLDDGRFRLLYQGRQEDKTDRLFSAVSSDGVHFEPEDTRKAIALAGRTADNEIMLLQEAEIAQIIEDHLNAPEERYKMLLCEYGKQPVRVQGSLFVSPDLLHWKRVEGVEWNNGNEPITGVFFNEQKGCFTILLRPDWGERRVGVRETRDWRTFTPFAHCLQCDALDQTLDELYGMPAFTQDGWMIGLPLIYRGFDGGNHGKYMKGTIHAELAYSPDGRYWIRSLREPFLSGMTKEAKDATGAARPLVWPASFHTAQDGSILIYGSASEREHGDAFSRYGDGCLCVWRVRRDGFIALSTGQKDVPGVVSTRETIWHGGEAHINLRASHATMAVYETTGGVWSTLVAPEGYSHEDCVPFSGDDTNWTPRFTSGKTLDALAGRTLILEILLENGEIYSIGGDCTPVFSIGAARYREKQKE